jgi:hypothetical protein
MRTFSSALILLMNISCASAEMLNGNTLEPLLNDSTVYGLPLAPDSWRQSFARNGETIYIDASGARTIGEWLVRGDKYCSIWPPSERMTCFEVESGKTADGKVTVTWISGGGGKRYEALLVKGLRVDEHGPVK